MFSVNSMDPIVSTPTENEATLQWYTPMFQGYSEDVDASTSDSLILLYAVARKDTVDKKTMKTYAGQLRVPQQKIYQLHNR